MRLERPEVAPQHRGLVHQPHGVRDALRGLAQYLHELARGWPGRAEKPASIRPRVVQRAQGARRQVLSAGELW